MNHALFVSFLNFGILAGGLIYFLRQPLNAAIVGRSEGFAKEIRHVGEELRRAREMYDNYSSKLVAIDSEVVALREDAKKRAAAIGEAVISSADVAARGLISDAKVAAEGLFLELKSQIARDLGVRAVEMAEKMIKNRMTEDDERMIRDRFMHQLEQSA